MSDDILISRAERYKVNKKNIFEYENFRVIYDAYTKSKVHLLVVPIPEKLGIKSPILSPKLFKSSDLPWVR